MTGSGVVTPFGSGVASFSDALRAGHSSISRIRGFDPTGFPVAIASECVTHFPSEPHGLHGKAGKMAWVAAREALATAGLDPQETTVGWTAAVGWTPPPTDQWTGKDSFDLAGARQWASRFPESRPGYAENKLGEALHLTGPGTADHAACSAGIHSFVHAARAMRQGRCQAFLSGASDSRCHPLGILGYARLGALTTAYQDEPVRASRPFDRDRTGFVIGEGAGFLVLESLDHARKRGAQPLAELAGWALGNDADRITDPHADGGGAIQCVEAALARAGLRPDEIDYLNAHGTSTPQNDRVESLAYAHVFGTGKGSPVIGSTKSLIGHLSMASSAVESIAAIEALRGGFFPPNLNLENCLPEGQGLHFAPGKSIEADIKIVLKTAYGLGGQNAAIIWKRFEDETVPPCRRTNLH